MRQLRREFRFAPERAHRFSVPRDRRMQRFQSDLPLQRQIPGAPHCSERTASKLRENLIVVANSPSHPGFGRLVYGLIWLATHHDHGTRRVPMLNRAKKNPQRGKAVRRVVRKRTVERRRQRFRRLWPNQLDRGHPPLGWSLPCESREAHRCQLPLIARGGRNPLIRLPFGGHREKLGSDRTRGLERADLDGAVAWPNPRWNGLARNRPLPFQ